MAGSKGAFRDPQPRVYRSYVSVPFDSLPKGEEKAESQVVGM
jgi:hypothetical protein